MTMKVQVNEVAHGVRAVVPSCFCAFVLSCLRSLFLSTRRVPATRLFPFDGTGRFGAHVIDHSIDSSDLVDNSV